MLKSQNAISCRANDQVDEYFLSLVRDYELSCGHEPSGADSASEWRLLQGTNYLLRAQFEEGYDVEEVPFELAFDESLRCVDLFTTSADYTQHLKVCIHYRFRLCGIGVRQQNNGHRKMLLPNILNKGLKIFDSTDGSLINYQIGHRLDLIPTDLFYIKRK